MESAPTVSACSEWRSVFSREPVVKSDLSQGGAGVGGDVGRMGTVTEDRRPVSGSTLRLVREDDLDDLEVLDKEIFHDLAYSKHDLRIYFNLFRSTWYVVDVDGDLAGHALIGSAAGTGAAWLLGLAVSARHQRRGLGRMLMTRAVEVMIGLEVADGYITVRPDNAAAYRLYQSFGFVQEGEERENYYGNGEPRKVLRRSFANP